LSVSSPSTKPSSANLRPGATLGFGFVLGLEADSRKHEQRVIPRAPRRRRIVEIEGPAGFDDRGGALGADLVDQCFQCVAP
jgi:hypothetical protein